MFASIRERGGRASRVAVAGGVLAGVGLLAGPQAWAAAPAKAASGGSVSIGLAGASASLSVNLDLGLGGEPEVPGDSGSLASIARVIGADRAWQAGWTGKGVDVAVIDTGVAPVKGLAGKVVNGPDLSFDSQLSGERYLDGYGHGTHMASIIAGRDTAGAPASYASGAAGFTGIAPDARIISLKVGAGDGSVDVSQVIAAVDWVTQHAHDPGMNIRVLNLSYGTDSLQSTESDPLVFAVEAARRQGILVVVSGGNDGTRNANLANPARNPNVLAVGAIDSNGTQSPTDDTVPDFADRGTITRHVDVVTPGVHVLGLRVPNGAADQAYPSARVGTRYFRGSGTSQSAAVASGAAALLLQRNPSLTPDQVKDLLVRGADPCSLETRLNTGAGLVDVPRSMALTVTSVSSLLTTALATSGTGRGSLDAARGTSRVTVNGVTLAGEKDIFGTGWNPTAWSTRAQTGSAWTGGSWNGTAMTGTGWTSTGDWASTTWTAASWSKLSWTDKSWSGRRWANGSWDSGSWTGRRWADSSWAGRRWADAGWS